MRAGRLDGRILSTYPRDRTLVLTITMPVRVHRHFCAPGTQWPRGSRLCAYLCAPVLLLVMGACTDRQHRNPLDPLTTNPLDNSTALDAVAGDNTVSLTWDYSQFDDLSGYRLHRVTPGADGTPQPTLSRDLAVTTLQFEDTDVVNGQTYQYRLSLLVEGDGELDLGRLELATPGPEVAWAADRSTGLVWKLSPDGRNGLFARGRFVDLAGMAVNRRDRSCWVSDAGREGLFRIGVEGDVDLVGGDLAAPGDLSLDPDGGTGWIVDAATATVHSFTPESADSLDLTQVDASFVDPFQVAAIGEGGCWVADREQGRILLYSVQGQRVADRRGFAGLQAIAADDTPLQPDGGNVVWALTEAGRRLLRLEVEGQELRLDLSFSQAMALDVDGRTGNCWVLGERDIALFGADGSRLVHWTEVELGGVDLTVDGDNDSVWIAAAGVLWKYDLELGNSTRLDGFTSAFRIAVDPGLPR